MNKPRPEPPLAEIDRSPVFLIISLVVTISFAWPAYLIIKSVNPWGFFMMVPALIAGFHALWLILNPFAWIYEDRIEIRPTWFHNHLFYFKDITEVQLKKNHFFVKFNDGEVDRININGIASKQTGTLLNVFKVR